MTITWEDPPPSRSGPGVPKGEWGRILAPLIERPGEWARIHEAKVRSQAGSLAMNLRSRRVQIPAGEWEFISRTVREEDGTPHFYIYARYLGGAG